MATPVYKRLTQARAPRQFAVAFVARSSLWLGDNHLLLVESSGYRETYKRFYFRDIQAITFQKTNGRAVNNWVFGVFGALLLTIAAVAAVEVAWMAAGTCLTLAVLLAGVPLVINHHRGPTCACQIRTAVQVEDVPSLCRVPQARRVLDQLRPLIAAAQGQLTSEEVTARMQEVLQAENPTEAEKPPLPAPVPPVLP